jgi:FkbM family methyltransferase
MKLGALFYPTEDQAGNKIEFDTLYIPYIYREIYFEGIYIDVLNMRKDMVIVDVGANIGITVQHFQPYAKKLYAIEPSPEHFEALKKNKEFNGWDNVELFNIALADRDGVMQFTQNTHNRTMNTLIVGKKTGEDTYEVKGPEALIHAKGYKGKIDVFAQSMDHFFETNKIEKVDFMKFDAEGAEDMILRSEGFKKVVGKIKAIMVEFHFPNWMDLVQYMSEFGFKARQYESSAKVVLFLR